MELSDFKQHPAPQLPVSVIIPTHNRRQLLKKAIDSVLGQTYRNFQLIVVDDGSVDDTGRLVATYAADITYIRQENKGPAAARNRGLAAAEHDLIAFLDDDDWFDRRKLEIQVAAMEQYREYAISHSQEIWFRRGRHLNQKKKHRKVGGDLFDRSLQLCAVSMSTVMIRRELFDAVGLFDEELSCCEDYDFWLRVSVDHPFLLLDTPLTLKDGGRQDQVSFRHRVGMDRLRIRAIAGLLASAVLSEEKRRLAAAELVRKCTIYAQGCIKHGRPDEARRYLELAASHAG